jgi:hypothetical protein
LRSAIVELNLACCCRRAEVVNQFAITRQPKPNEIACIKTLNAFCINQLHFNTIRDFDKY